MNEYLTIEGGVLVKCSMDASGSIIIPDSVTSIGKSAFWGCSSLESIVVSPGNAVYDSRDNCNAIIETSTNRLIVKCRSTVLPDGIS